MIRSIDGADAPGRPLPFAHGAPSEARDARLSVAEWLWVCNAVVLLPVYVLLAVLGAVLADGAVVASPWALVSWLAFFGAVLHVASWLHECLSDSRRVKAVLSRPLREGRHVWATVVGDRVRVYRVEPQRTIVPHLWPLSLGVRGRVFEGREFDAEDDAEGAFAYAAEIERLSAPDAAARALASALNH